MKLSFKKLQLITSVAAVVLIVGVIAIWGCNDNSLLIALLSVLVLGGKATVDDLLPISGSNNDN